MQRRVVGARIVALHQRLADGASLCARQGDQPFVQFLQPGQLDDRLVFHHVLGIGPRNQLGQVQVALLVLHQHHQARCSARVRTQTFQHDLCTNDRLDALAPRFPVELDGAEQVVEIGNGDGRLAIFGRGLDDFINTAGRVNDREFGVQAQVDKHAFIVVFPGLLKWRCEHHPQHIGL